jgi:hypothetical protein
MSAISDVQALYGGIQGTWVKSREHICSHFVMFIIVYVLRGATFPHIQVPMLSPNALLNNGWYKLATETGIIYASLLIPVLIVAGYASFISTASRFLLGMAMAIIPPLPKPNYFRIANSWMLEPLAILLKKEEFTLTDLVLKSSELVMRYQSMKNDIWENYQRSIYEVSKNSQIYLGDFLFFFLGWNLIFSLARHSSWLQDNSFLRYRVSLILIALIVMTWFRVAHAVAAVPALQLLYVSMMIRSDTQLAPLLDIPEESKEKIRNNIDDLLRRDKEVQKQGPSIARYALRNLGLKTRYAGKGLVGWLALIGLGRLYLKGERFETMQNTDELNFGTWTDNYKAYIFYKLIFRAQLTTKSIAAYLRFLVTGSP